MRASFAAVGLSALFLAGCASGPARPPTGPGSGSGASYVPLVQSARPEDPGYQALVARCQHDASGLPFIKPKEHQEALWVVDTTATLFAGWVTGYIVGPGSMVIARPAAVVNANTTWQATTLFDDWVYSPQRAIWLHNQETSIANCMTRAGYANADATVKVTWIVTAAHAADLRTTGRDTYSAEKLAKASSCAPNPIANLVSRGPGYENHGVACSNGEVLAVHCEFGNCRVANNVASK